MIDAPASQDAHHRLQKRTRQVLWTGLEIMQINETGLFPPFGPARQTREHVTLADTCLAPEHDAETPALVVSLVGQGGQSLKLLLMDTIHIHIGGRWTVDPIIGEWVAGDDPLKECFEV